MNDEAPRVERPKKDLISNFNVQDNEFPWTKIVVDAIRARRKALSGLLFFDILLQLGGIRDPSSLYPPQSVDDLNRLLDAIEGASYDSMKRDCLLFYLLKWHYDGREETYAIERKISPHYAALADIYWQLDTGTALECAVSRLADVRIVKDYTSKIIETLSLSPNSSVLIRKFMRLCKPPIRELADLERYLVALAEYSIVEAWQYQRRFPERFPAKKDLIHRLLTWAVTPKPKSHALAQLLSVPFSSFEEDVVQSFVMQPPEGLPDASVAVLRDMIGVRLIQSCKYAAAVRFDKQFPASSAGTKGTWGVERSRIMKEVISTMPAIERLSLEHELETLDTGARLSRQIGASGLKATWSSLNGSADLGASLEDLGNRAANASRRSIAERLASRSQAISRPGRIYLPNGVGATSLSTPGASSSAAHAQKELRQESPPHPPQPLSAQPTLVVEEGIGVEQSFTFVNRPSHGQIDAQISRDKSKGKGVDNVVSPPQSSVNGINTLDIMADRSVNTSSKSSAFASRNAFFAPLQPVSTDQKREEIDISIHKPPQRQDRYLDAQLSTSNQEMRDLSTETESNGLPEHDEEKQVSADIGYPVDKDSRSILSENEDIDIFGFGGSATLNAPQFTSSPRSSRQSAQRTASLNANNERDASNVSFPGAFTSEDEDADATPKSPAPKSPTQNHFGESFSATRPSRTTEQRKSRKRAASPEAGLDGQLSISIPGALFYEEDEARSARTEQSGEDRDVRRGMSPTANEVADELGPLPSSSRLRGKAVPKTPRTPNGRSTSRRRVSRAESIDSDDSQALGSTGGPVRRSSRLSAVPASPLPAFETAEKLTRPRKSTRTSGAGATATGRGATKRR